MQNIFFKNILVLSLILGLLALTIVNGIKFYSLQKQTAEITPLANESASLSPIKNSVTARTIMNWHLFGKENAITTQINVPKTTLRLKLIGIISSTKEGQSRVIIENASRQQKHYKAGDKIKNNVSVKSIHPDHIVILHNSREEIVILKTLKSKKDILKKVVIQ